MVFGFIYFARIEKDHTVVVISYTLSGLFFLAGCFNAYIDHLVDNHPKFEIGSGIFTTPITGTYRIAAYGKQGTFELDENAQAIVVLDGGNLAIYQNGQKKVSS